MQELTGAAVLAAWIPLACALARRAEIRERGTAPSAVAAAVTAGAAVLVALATRAPWDALRDGLAAVGLIVAGFADARTGLLFDAVIVPTVALTVAAATGAGEAPSACAGMLAVGLPCLVLALASHGRGMGLGDVKASLALGAAFGPRGAWFALLAASVAALAVAWARRRCTRGSAVRFGPYLAFGAAVALAGRAATPALRAFGP